MRRFISPPQERNTVRGMFRTLAFGMIAITLVGCGGAPPQPVAPSESRASAPAAAPPAAEAAAPAANLLQPRRREANATPMPMSKKGHAVNWWFAFKFNTATFSGCEGDQACPFGGDVQNYHSGEGLEFATAASDAPTLAASAECIGQNGDDDPVGATFGQVYKGKYFYVLWNDQFYNDPAVEACHGQTSCSAPWGHSKGMVAWNDDGDGFVLQVSTPSWPAAGSKTHPRASDGNTLGCVTDNDVLVSQHFFSVKLAHADLLKVLGALANASVLTDPANPQIVNNGGPDDVQTAVSRLGQISKSSAFTKDQLSSGVTLISKPSALHVAPWQMVSSVLGSQPLRVATWWQGANKMPSTTSKTKVTCWDESLDKPGAVDIATTGTWDGKSIGLKGAASKDYNHAKIGVVTASGSSSVIFGDMNQDGDLTGSTCADSQNARGGLFFVVDDTDLHKSVSALLKGESAPK